MRTKELLIFILFYSITCSCLGQTENTVHFYVDGFEYKVNSSEMQFNLKIENLSSDTVSIVKPLPYFFGKTYKFANLDGINGSPYSVNLESSEQLCDQINDYRMDSPAPYSILLDSRSILVLPPGESKTYDGIKLNLTTDPFCAEREYKIEISYDLQPTDWDANEANKIKQSIENINREIETYNKQIENKDYGQFLTLTSNSERVLDGLNSLEFANKLSPKIVTSNSSKGKAY